jgi:hypothetical protein
VFLAASLFGRMSQPPCFGFARFAIQFADRCRKEFSTKSAASP